MGVDKLVVRKPGGTILFVHQGGVSFKAIKLQLLISVSVSQVPTIATARSLRDSASSRPHDLTR